MTEINFQKAMIVIAAALIAFAIATAALFSFWRALTSEKPVSRRSVALHFAGLIAILLATSLALVVLSR